MSGEAFLPELLFQNHCSYVNKHRQARSPSLSKSFLINRSYLIKNLSNFSKFKLFMTAELSRIGLETAFRLHPCQLDPTEDETTSYHLRFGSNNLDTSSKFL